MAYLRNRRVNLLNLHFGIHSLALTGGGAFFCVYLRKAGLSIPAVLTTMAVILMGRFLIRPVIVPLAVRFGLRALLIAGTIISSLQYLLLPEVHGVGVTLVAMCLVASVGETTYWSVYHAYFASVGDHEHRGHQIGMREAINAILGIMSPLVTVAVLVTLGPHAAFYVTAGVAAFSAVPLFWGPKVSIAPHVQGAWKAAIPGVLLFIADGWMSSGLYFLWQFALFDSLNESLFPFGGALALAALAGAAGSLLLGRNIDIGHGSRAVWIALSGMAVVIAVRALSTGHPVCAVAANALASIGSCLYIPTLMTAIYNQSKRSPCALRFQAAAEGGWDIGGAAGCLTAAALLSLGESVSVTLLLPFLGLAAILFQLRGYYAEDRAISELAAAE